MPSLQGRDPWWTASSIKLNPLSPISSFVVATPTLEMAQLAVSVAGLCRALEAIVALPGGENSQVFEVRCSEPDRALVLKVYPDNLRWKMAKEVFVYGLLTRAPRLPTPEVLVSDDSGALISEAYLIMKKLPGALAASEMSSLQVGDIEKVYEQVGEILRAVHGVTFDSFGYITTEVVDGHLTNAGYMEHQFEKKIRQFAELGGDPRIRRAAERTVASSEFLLAECSQAVLCHDDLHEGNLLVEKRDSEWLVCGVLDVENAVAGDPLLDLAKTDYYSVRGDRVKHRGLLSGYGPLPPKGEEIMRLYGLYHALELWDWFASTSRDEPLDEMSRTSGPSPADLRTPPSWRYRSAGGRSGHLRGVQIASENAATRGHPSDRPTSGPVPVGA
jgi:aminoglycoside phosphotransferase (APT) family kinase protein